MKRSQRQAMKAGLHNENTSTEVRLVVCLGEGGDSETATALAAHLSVPLLEGEAQISPSDLVLLCDEHGLALTSDGQSIRGDFTRMLPRLRHNNLTHEILVRAGKLKDIEGSPRAFDATAGMGEDSLLLAAAGYDVTLCEYDPVIAALLRDTLRRAAYVPELSEIVARMHLVEGDSTKILQSLETAPDLILLDPMFPARQKSSLVKKKFQLIKQLEKPCSNEEELVQAALDAKPRRVVIKRPLKGPFLADIKPSYSLPGKTIRYDVITL